MSNEMFSAMQLLREDEMARNTFEEIKRSSGTLSGWDLARSLGIEGGGVYALREVLQRLRVLGVVKSNGEGLEGYYYLTDLGFKLRLMAA